MAIHCTIHVHTKLNQLMQSWNITDVNLQLVKHILYIILKYNDLKTNNMQLNINNISGILI